MKGVLGVIVAVGIGAAVSVGTRPTRLPEALPADSAAWEVRFAYVGYTGLAKSIDCDARANPAGYDSLLGVLKGFEPPDERGEDVEYVGTLRRSTKMDYCLSRGRRGVNDDERTWCVATLRGAAPMQVSLTVYGEAGRGAYLRATPLPGPPDSLIVGGDCEAADMTEIRQDYPSGESAGTPDGQDIPDRTHPVLVDSGGLVRLTSGLFPPAPPDGWGMYVVGRVPP